MRCSSPTRGDLGSNTLDKGFNTTVRLVLSTPNADELSEFSKGRAPFSSRISDCKLLKHGFLF